jgi:glycosyltransferase involved in cell wall biosynthesis
MENPLITICIPLYNGIEYLEETLISIRNQVYSRWCVIVGVNGHGNGGEVLKRANELAQMDDRIQVVNLPHVRGISQADNALIALAKTDWIAHLDADDLWHTQKLEYQVQTLRALQNAGQEIDLLCTHCRYFGSMSNEPVLPKGFLTEDDFKLTNPIVHSSIFFKKGSITYPDEEGGTVPQDYAAFLDLLGKGGKFYSMDTPLTLHRVYPQSHFNASGKQNPSMVANRFWARDPTLEQATVVSAFYRMPSKFSEETYIHWARLFFGQIPCFLVLFIEEEMVETFKQIRAPFDSRTRLIVLPRSEWQANVKWGYNIWEQQALKDHENKHSPDLYKLWYEKKEFVLRAAAINPFGHGKYVWADAGLIRSKEVQGWFSNFAVADRVPEDKMLLLQIEAFTQEDCLLQEDGLYGNFTKKNRIGGGIQAGSAKTWLAWSEKYDAVMARYIAANRFIGKDQSIMASIILEDPASAVLIRPYGYYKHPLNLWFFLGLWLGANNARFKKLLEGY